MDSASLLRSVLGRSQRDHWNPQLVANHNSMKTEPAVRVQTGWYLHRNEYRRAWWNDWLDFGNTPTGRNREADSRHSVGTLLPEHCFDGMRLPDRPGDAVASNWSSRCRHFDPPVVDADLPAQVPDPGCHPFFHSTGASHRCWYPDARHSGPGSSEWNQRVASLKPKCWKTEHNAPLWIRRG